MSADDQEVGVSGGLHQDGGWTAPGDDWSNTRETVLANRLANAVFNVQACGSFPVHEGAYSGVGSLGVVGGLIPGDNRGQRGAG
nr:hypothetical protein [Terrabacter sp. MAHUQ-38]